MSLRDSRTRLAVGALAVAGLTGVTFVALGDPADRGAAAGAPAPHATVCAAPADLPGTVVTVTAWDMGRMMGGPAGGPMMGSGGASGGAPVTGSMRLALDRAVVPAGVVTIAVTDVGSLAHEVVVLPLRADGSAGARTTKIDRTVDEAASLGEASSSCGAGGGSGIEPGATGWVTTTLAAGRYELVCNLPGHYADGMHVLLTVA